MNRHRHPTLFTSLLVVLVTVVGPGSFAASAATPPRNLSLAPAATMIVVNTGGDDTESDSYLTLREAILIAVGGTGPLGLDRPLAPGERSQVPGCMPDPTGNIPIPGPCGAGVDDFIRISASVTQITLVTDLPPLSDSATTSIDGGTTTPYVKIDGSGVARGLDLASDGAVVQHLELANMVDYGLQVSGGGGLISNVIVSSVKGDGILVTGGGSSITSVQIGPAAAQACIPGGITGSGIVLSGATAGNEINDASVRCVAGYGIHLDGIGTSANTIHGGTIGRIDGNGLGGIYESNGAAGNVWTDIPIYNNGAQSILKDSHATAPAPVLTSIVGTGGNYTVSGTARKYANVELYQAQAGGGQTYVATVVADDLGNWSSAATSSPTSCFAAFQTATASGTGVSMDESSEFGLLCPLKVFLPLVQR